MRVLLLTLTLTLTVLTSLTPAQSALLTPLTPSVRDIDDVGPALYNATQTALTNAQAILSNYTTVLHGIAIPSGITVSFFGYFLLSPVLFLSAFVSGGGACFVATSTVLSDHSTPTDAWLSIGAMLLGGALLGFIAMRALPVGLFLVGASVGAIFASALRNSLLPKLFPDDPRTAFIILAVSLGLVLGILALIFEKHMLIFSTAYAGACAAVVGIGHFAGHFPSSHDLNEDVQNGHFDMWVVLYLLGALVLGTVGMCFQFWLVADKPMPEYAPYDSRRRRRRRERRARPQWSDDDDDDWGGELYVERVPLPPQRKPREAAYEKPHDGFGERQVVRVVDAPVARHADVVERDTGVTLDGGVEGLDEAVDENPKMDTATSAHFSLWDDESTSTTTVCSVMPRGLTGDGGGNVSNFVTVSA